MLSPTGNLLLIGAIHAIGLVAAFTTNTRPSHSQCMQNQCNIATQLFGQFVSVGLGPGETKEDDGEETKEMVAGVDYEIPDHEAYRTSRRSPIDEQSDKWFGDLLGDEDQIGVLTSLANDARKMLLTPVPLVNEVSFAQFRLVDALGGRSYNRI